jgi:hypothetical protein
MTTGFLMDPMPMDHGTSPVVLVCSSMTALFHCDDRLIGTLTMAVVAEGPSDLTVSMLRSEARGRGSAGRAMDVLAMLCDVHLVTMRLQSVSLRCESDIDADKLDQRSLDAFYGRRGFVRDDANWRAYSMIRVPGAHASNARTTTPVRNARGDMAAFDRLLGETTSAAA